MDVMKNLENMLKNFDLNSNATLMVVLGLGLILYTSVAAPKVPRTVTKYLDNTFLKLALILLIAYVASKDAPLAIVATIALLVTLQTGANQANNEVTTQSGTAAPGTTAPGTTAPGTTAPKELFTNTKYKTRKMAGFENVNNNELTQQTDLPVPGLVANVSDNITDNKVVASSKDNVFGITGLDENNNASFEPINEPTFAEQSNQEIPKGIPSYAVESVALYQPSNNELLSVGDMCGSDRFANLNGAAYNEVGLLDNTKDNTTPEVKKDTNNNTLLTSNCSGLSNIASGYGGLELAEF